MARRILILAGMAAALTVRAAGAEAAAITYRTASIVSFDSASRKVTVDAGSGLASFRLAHAVDTTGLQPGDSVILGEGDVNGERRIVHLRRASAPPVPVAAVAAVPEMTSSIRRPMLVVPNPRGRGAAAAPPAPVTYRQPATFVMETAPSPDPVPAPEPVAMPAPQPAAADAAVQAAVEVSKTPAILQEPAAEEPSLETRRAAGLAAFEEAVLALDPIVQHADALWNAYRQGCPTTDRVHDRSWLSLSTAAPPSDGLCGERLRQLAAVSSRIRGHIEAAQSQARTSSVLPGRMRSVLELHGLDPSAPR